MLRSDLVDEAAEYAASEALERWYDELEERAAFLPDEPPDYPDELGRCLTCGTGRLWTFRGYRPECSNPECVLGDAGEPDPFAVDDEADASGVIMVAGAIVHPGDVGLVLPLDLAAHVVGVAGLALEAGR